MVEPNRSTARRWLHVALCIVSGVALNGCGGSNASEAVIDGFFGGISDTIASVIVGILTSGGM